MKNLPVANGNLLAQMGSAHNSSRPATFLEALQQSFKGTHWFEIAHGMKYLDAFKQMLAGKSGINWAALENNDILLELQDYAFIYIPKSPGACFDITLEFLDIQSDDVMIGAMCKDEINAFKMAVEAACGVSDAVNLSTSNLSAWVATGFTPIAVLNWVLLWCMIVWRFERAREYLQKGYDLEVRKDWTVVARQPKDNKQPRRLTTSDPARLLA
jgi:hypothetical protein